MRSTTASLRSSPWSGAGTRSPDVLLGRCEGIASRLVTYLAEETIDADPAAAARWGEIAAAIRR